MMKITRREGNRMIVLATAIPPSHLSRVHPVLHFARGKDTEEMSTRTR